MRCTSVLVTMVVMVVINAVMVQGDCQDRCNIVFCGQSSGPNDLHYVYKVANLLRIACYKNRENSTCGANDCNLGTVFYKKQNQNVRDVAVCPMTTLVDQQTKAKCIKDARDNLLSDYNDNKLEHCFQHANHDPHLMGSVDVNCTYTVVVVARNQLTNSHVRTLKVEADELKAKGARIHCYVVGKSEKYDLRYDDICDEVKKYEDYNTLKLSDEINRIYEEIKCCPGDVEPTLPV